MTSYKPVADPWEEAMNPPELPQGYHGRITVEAFTVMFVEDPATGKKMKVPYDPQVLTPSGSEPRPVTMIKISLTPVKEDLKWDITRDLLVTSSDWTKITLPSIKDMGIMQLKDLDGRFAQVEMAETGRTYQSNGETKQATTFKFLRLFKDEAECKEAAGVQVSSPAPASTPAPNQASTPNQNGSERATAVKFLEIYVKNVCRQASGDLQKARELLQVQIAQQVLLAKYFTVDSPEVADLLVKYLEAPF